METARLRVRALIVFVSFSLFKTIEKYRNARGKGLLPLRGSRFLRDDMEGSILRRRVVFFFRSSSRIRLLFQRPRRTRFSE